MAGRSIPVNKAFIDRLVDQRYGRAEQFGALSLIRMRKSTSQTLNLSPKLAPVASIDQISFFVLPNPFFR